MSPGRVRPIVVTERFPPCNDPRALRWGAIARAWRERGIEPIVVTPKRSGDGTASSAPTWLRAAYRASWGQIRWPDYASRWTRHARREALEQVAGNPGSPLVTVSNPYSDHLVGLAVKRAFPRTRWLVDIGDPFSIPHAPRVNNSWLYAGRNVALEREVLRLADVVTVTNGATSAAYETCFPECRGKIHVVPPLVSVGPQITRGDQRSHARRHLVFAGRLYRNLRSPGPLLNWFRELVRCSEAEWHLHFFGDVDPCRAEFWPFADLLGRRVWLHGMTSHEIVGRALSEADALVNIGNDNPHQVPSKLVEYMAMGRPILNVSPRADDTARELLKDYPDVHHLPAVFTPSDQQAAFEFVDAGLPSVPAEQVATLVAPYQADAVAGEYLRLLDRPPILAGPHRRMRSARLAPTIDEGRP